MMDAQVSSPALRADFYRLGLAGLLTAARMAARGYVVTYASQTRGIAFLDRAPGANLLTRRLGRTAFEKTVSEYEGAFYLIQHVTAQLTQRYFEERGFGWLGTLRLYDRHYQTEKCGSVVKFLLQREVKRFLTWLIQHRQSTRPPNVLMVPDEPLYRFLIDEAEFIRGAAWQVRFHPSAAQSVLTNIGELIKCWSRLLRSLWSQRLCWASRPTDSFPIGFRAHWPRKEGLLRTDFLVDGKSIHVGNVIFYLEDATSDYGKTMCRFLEAQDYRYVVLNELSYPVRSLPRLFGDYAWLPLRAFLRSLVGKRDPAFPLVAAISRFLISSKVDLLLHHYRFRCLFSFHSAGYEMMVSSILSERAGCQFLSYNYGITVFQAQWSDYAFQNAHAFFSWGPDILSVYQETHKFDEVIQTGFWGFPEYRKALAQRSELRAVLGADRDASVIIFYDSPYFPERSPFTAGLLLEFYLTVLECSDLPDVLVILKMKNHHNEKLSIYPPAFREEFRKVWEEIKVRPNVTVSVTLDWDPLQMIAASDVNVTLELNTPSTIALMCGKAGFFLNTVEEHIHHPLFPKYKGRLIFLDKDALVKAIRSYLELGSEGTALIDEGDLDGYNAGSDEDGLRRFREEAWKRAGLLPVRPSPTPETATR